MMHDEAELRIIRKISDAELERRWKAVRFGMAEKKIDFLIIQNSADYMGGNIKWFSFKIMLINFVIFKDFFP